MPYTNVPDDKQDAMESCVSQVMAKQPGLEKPNAIGICYRSVVEGKSLDDELRNWAAFVADATKAGARHSRVDQADIQAMHDSARTMHDASVKQGAACNCNGEAEEPEKPMPMPVLPNKSLDMLITFGEGIKALGGGKVGGYLIRYGNEKEPDLSEMKDWFDAETNFGARAGDGSDTTINHGIPLRETQDAEERKALDEFAALLLPPIKTKRDKFGVFADSVLDLANQYQAAVYDMVKKGKLLWSSGALPHLVKRTLMPNGTHHVDQWIIGEAAYTPTPAEPRLGAIVSLKSLAGGAGLPTPDGAPAKQASSPERKTIMAGESPPASEAVLEGKFTVLETKFGTLEKTLGEVLTELRKPSLPGIAAAITPVPDEAETKPFKNLGDQLQAVIKAAIAPTYADPRLEKYNKKRLYELKATGMSEGSFADGGAFVQTEFGNNLIERTYAIGKVLARVQDQPVGEGYNSYSALYIDETSRATGSRWGGIQFYRLGEGGTITAARPKFRRKETKPEKIAALCYLTDELVQDAKALEGHVNRLFPLEAKFMLENELFNGAGAGEGTGVLNAAATISIAKETGQAANTIVTKNLSKMWARLLPSSEAKAVWYIDKSVTPQLDELFVAAGTGGVDPRIVSYSPDGAVMRIKGAPVETVEYCAALGTVGDIVLVDFNEYIGVSKGGLRTDSSIHVQFTTDEMVLRFIMRYLAEPTMTSAITPRNGGNTLSAYISLATRA